MQFGEEKNLPNPVVHFEILGKNHEALQQYYHDLFDWNITQASPDFPYGLVSVEEQGEGIGGGVGSSMDGRPQAMFYVQVDDIQTSLDRAAELGGDITMPVTVIPGMVAFAHIKDIEGNLIGLVSSETPPAE